MEPNNDSAASLINQLMRLKTVIDDTESTYMGFSFFYIVLGTLLNLWCLAAIVSSPQLRQSMRNKVICSMLLIHLTDSLLRLPLFFVVLANGKLKPEGEISCFVFSAIANATLIQDFVANWLLVVILIVFINHIVGCCSIDKNISHPLLVKVGSLALLLAPWVCSLVLIPGVMHDFHMKRPNITGSQRFCLYPTKEALPVFKLLDTAVPVLLSAVLLSVAAVLRHRHNSGRITPSTTERQLIGSGPDVDRILPYLLAVVISCFSELGLVLSCFEAVFPTGINRYRMIFASYVLSDSRTLLMPLPWLLFADVKERVKAWRPCGSPASSDNDASFQYSREG